MIKPHLSILFSCILLCILAPAAFAQKLLNRTISVEVSGKPLSEVLDAIGRQGGFHFSYNSNILRADSLVTFSVRRITVRQALERLFDASYQYREVDDYVIIQRSTEGQPYVVSGYVVDKETGERISNASVYERQQLASTLTNDQGFFRLKLKDKYPSASISISKLSYSDTSMDIGPGNDQELTVSLMPKRYELTSVTVTPESGVEKTWFGNFFLSSRQKMQSLNLNKFFVDKPIQLSVTPGLGTHGRMSGQVVNKFSLNVIGGYTAGVNGVEIGTVFNIVKKDVRYVQIAGFFNIAGGKVGGVQIAGFHNQVLDSVDGVQAAGFSNWVTGSFEGVQTAGFLNVSARDVTGVQAAGFASCTGGNITGVQASGAISFIAKNGKGVSVAGLATMTGKDMEGVQASGYLNIVGGQMKGVQAAGLFNYARDLRGVQIGVINICDTSSGYSIGIVNFVRKGMHKLNLSANEFLPYNAAYKSGNNKLYSILTFGADYRKGTKVFAYGYGLGKEIRMSKRLSLDMELISGALYLGSWKETVPMNRLQACLTFHLHKQFSFYAGPAFGMVYADEGQRSKETYRSNFSNIGAFNFSMWDNAYGWLGWQAGINLF